MNRTSLIQVAVIVGVVAMWTGGCTQEYNGAWGFENSSDVIAQQQRQAKAAEEAKEKAADAKPQAAAEAQQQAASADARTASRTTIPGATPTPEHQAQFESPAQAETYAAGDRPSDAANDATVRAVASSSDNAADPSVRPLSLYGVTNNATPSRAGQFDGSDNVRRVTFAAQGADFDPAVDPTGQWIVYASTQHRKSSDLFIKRVDGTTVTQLTNDPGNNAMPAFSPNGRRIAFASDRAGNWDIYMMDVTGGQPVQLTNDSTDDIHPSFSPDGKQLVYCSHGGQSGQWELVVIDVDNPATKRFIGYGLLPSWSPTENKILFQRAQERGTRWFSIWTIDYVNGEGVRPTQIAASTNAAAITPTWSPDGRHIAFCTVIDPGTGGSAKPSQADIWIVASDGTGRSNLTRNQYANLQPVWAKDGSIYFVSNRSGAVDNIFALRPDRAIQVAQQRSDTLPLAAAPTPGTPTPVTETKQAPVSPFPTAAAPTPAPAPAPTAAAPAPAAEPHADASTPAANEGAAAPAKETASVPDQ